MKKIGIITGASSGMGREFVRVAATKLSSLDELWVIARRGDRLASIRRTFGSRIRPIELDLSDENKISSLAAMLENEQPDVRLLINSAGLGIIGKVEEVSSEETMNMVRVNVDALTYLCSVVIPYMRRGSHIINMASSAAFLPQPSFAVYAASKSYVLSFSRALNSELKTKGIHVTAVCPGPVKTEFFDIAEKHRTIAFYKKLVMASPSKVVNLAFRDAAKNKEISVYSLTMKLSLFITKILPHSLLIRIMGIF